MGELMQTGLWKGLLIGLLLPSMLMACGDATDLENTEVEPELNGAEVEEDEEGLTFALSVTRGMSSPMSSSVATLVNGSR